MNIDLFRAGVSYILAGVIYVMGVFHQEVILGIIGAGIFFIHAEVCILNYTWDKLRGEEKENDRS